MEDRALLAKFADVGGILTQSFNGIAVDAGGNVHAESLLGTEGARLHSFAADGNPLRAPISIGSGTLESGHLVVLDESVGNFLAPAQAGDVLDLWPTGNLYAITPATGQVRHMLDLRTAVHTDTSLVWDVREGRSRTDVGQFVDPSSATYGDIAYRQIGNHLYLIVTGLSGKTPFVTRLQISGGAAGGLSINSRNRSRPVRLILVEFRDFA